MPASGGSFFDDDLFTNLGNSGIFSLFCLLYQHGLLVCGLMAIGLDHPLDTGEGIRRDRVCHRKVLRACSLDVFIHVRSLHIVLF